MLRRPFSHVASLALSLTALASIPAGCGGGSGGASPAQEDAGADPSLDASLPLADASSSGPDAHADVDAVAPRDDAGPARDASAEAGAPPDGGAPDGGAPDGGAPDGGAPADGGAPFAAGTGFASSATRWPVPPSGLADGFFSSAYTLGARGWLVVDLDGDRLPDLVQTSDSQNASGFVWSDLQGPYWRVFKGTGSGFAASATRFSVPPSGLTDGFFSAYYGNDTRHWSLYDLDGDGRPELVQTADPTKSGGIVFKDAQGAYWKVWRSGAAGFGPSFTRFAVPESGLADGFFSTAYCLDARCWSLLDLDADGTLDLVQTADPARSGGIVFSDVNGPYWRVWAGSASGFSASARRFAVPASGLSDGFFAPVYASAAPGTRFWSLVDLDGDRRLDLVHTADPTKSGGVVWSDTQGPFWRAFLGGTTGFGAAARVGVPASGKSDGFFASSYFASPTLGGERVWMTIDLDGDRRPELLQSADPARTGGIVFTDVQGAYWKVWRLSPSGATGPARWSVPASGLSDGFFSPFWTDSTNGTRSWFLRDLDGDGRQDLVQCADTARSGLYVFSDAQGAYWKVYRGR